MEGSASQAGFYYQNNIAALKIIDCLFFKSDINEIRLENYDRGNHIDDIIIYRKDRTDYYQIKWSEDEEKVYSLHGMLKTESKENGKSAKKSLFKQLAEGYQSAKSDNGKFSITLYTTKKGGNQKLPSQGLNHGFLELIDNVFEPVKQLASRYDCLPNYGQYQESLEKIRQECALDEEEFDEFIKCLEFKFSQPPTDEIQRALKHKIETLGIETSLFEKLLDATVKWSISGSAITKEIVLEELGIAGRFEDKLSHYFSTVAEEYYVVNQSFGEQLNQALTELRGGYIFIEGLPGIGKSTALTKFKEKHEDVTLTYYCFIPDLRNNFGVLRHQSQYFLQSLCNAIEKNFPEVELPGVYSEDYKPKLSGYIEKLGTLERNIIFIIDGLDHVHRDSTLGDNSMLNSITGTLPENIFFILSSQYVSVLSTSVKLLVQSDTRRHIRVAPFGQREIKKYLLNKGINGEKVLDQVERVSGGIPLYLHYITELLLSVGPDQYQEELDDFPNLVDGQINYYHDYLFSRIEEDSFSRWVLAVLAYRKENTSVETINEILKMAGESRGIIEVESVIRTFSHLLKQVDGRSYAIFHNSFREFIISKTTDLRDLFNNAIIMYYEQNPFTDDSYRNYFRHLFDYGLFDKVISYTTLEWIKRAWESFRSFDEIAANIDVALESAIEKHSLSDFIRIAFLKDQFMQSKEMIDNSDIDMSIVLLNVGETANSLRTIWDGDFVLTNKEYFSYYTGKYLQKTGNLPPSSVLKQGLAKPLMKKQLSNFKKELKLQALLPGDIIQLFRDVDDISWTPSDEDRRDFIIRPEYSESENQRINRKIKYEIIDYLFECRQYKKIVVLTEETLDNKVVLRAKVALIKILLPGPERSTALEIIKRSDFSSVKDKIYFDLIVFCSDYLSNDEIVQLFPARELQEPQLFEEIVDKEGSRFSLRTEIISLYNELKILYIFQSELVESADDRTLFLDSPAAEIYESIFLLANLWNQGRTGNGEIENALDLLKNCIESLYVEREADDNHRARGLFDMNTDNTFIASSIKFLFKDLFQFAASQLNEAQLEDLVMYWIELDNSGDGFRHYTVGLTIAAALMSSKMKLKPVIIHKVILQSEATARLEHDTSTLTSYLCEVAEKYGTFGFKEDFQRIYNQLIDISFGLGYRKDYQATNIIAPMDLMHLVDPENTLRRLSEVLNIQYKLGEAGNPRMKHISLTYFIKFMTDKFPALAFQLLELEELNIDRDETMSIILECMIMTCNTDKLKLYQAIIKTLSRWDSSLSRDEYFSNLAKILLERAIHLKNESITEEIWQLLNYHSLVEFDNVKELNEIVESFKQKGIDVSKLSIPEAYRDLDKQIKATEQEEKKGNKIKFKFSYNKIDFDELVELFRINFDEFFAYIQEQIAFLVKNRRNQTLRREYHAAKRTLSDFIASSPDGLEKTSSEVIYSMIRAYVNLKNRLVFLNADPYWRDVSELFDQFFDDITNCIGNENFSKYFSENFDGKKWAESLLSETKSHLNYDFANVLDSSEIFRFVEVCPIGKLNQLVDFIDGWTDGRNRSVSLLKIANRLLYIDLDDAKRVLLMLSKFEYDSVLFPRESDSNKLDFDIIESILNVDSEFGKRFLLHNYYIQKRKYSRDLTGAIDQLMKYSRYFDNEPEKAYYEANLQYNMGLAEGLPPKDDKYGFILEHKESIPFDEIVIRHLIWLFGYPVIKIREAAIQASFDLLYNDSSLLEKFIDRIVVYGDDNQIEYGIAVLQGIALKNPTILLGFKDLLLGLLQREHFNIVTTASELLHLLNDSQKEFLSVNELGRMSLLFSAKADTSESVAVAAVERRRIHPYSNFQSGLCSEINFNDNSDSDLLRDVNDEMQYRGWGGYDREQDAAIHRTYNINTNYDTIEIQSPFYDDFKNCLNKIFYRKILRNHFNDEFIQSIKNKFRIYDPSKLLYKVVKKPEFINWFPARISAADFMNFGDFERLMDDFFKRSPDHITIVESGSQRVNRYKETSGTCYFEITAFLKEANFDISEVRQLPFNSVYNNYTYELSTQNLIGENSAIKPLLQTLVNNLKGEENLIGANLLSDVFLNLEIEKKNGLELYFADEKYPLKFSKWISSYKDGPVWRRFKPSSDGFILEMRKSIMSEYLQKNNLILFYNVRLKRSTDTDRTENIMKWKYFEKNVEFEI